jgi:hypothetical protein
MYKVNILNKSSIVEKYENTILDTKEEIYHFLMYLDLSEYKDTDSYIFIDEYNDTQDYTIHSWAISVDEFLDLKKYNTIEYLPFLRDEGYHKFLEFFDLEYYKLF